MSSHQPAAAATGTRPASHIDDDADSGPPWSWAQLNRALRAVFGQNRAGHVDSEAVADVIGVSPRTVQRWLHAGVDEPAAAVRIPAVRLDLLTVVLGPDGETRRAQDREARYAAEALARLPRTARGRQRSPWQAKRWLEPHLVEVREHEQLGLMQVTSLRRDDRRPVTASSVRSGVLQQVVEVPTRFHATLVVAQVLRAVDRWRVHPHEDLVPVPRQQVWLSGGDVDLADDTAGVMRTAPPAPAPRRRRAPAAAPELTSPAQQSVGGDADGTQEAQSGS